MEKNAQKKKDRRILYTRSIIKESIIRLLQDMPLDKITVTAICKEAEINRGTFYAHYQTPSEALQELETEYAERMISTAYELLGEGEYHHSLALPLHKAMITDSMLRLLLQYAPSASNMQKQFTDGIEKILTPYLIQHLGYPKAEAHAASAFLISGCYAVNMQLREDDSSSEMVERIINFINEIIMKGLVPFSAM